MARRLNHLIIPLISSSIEGFYNSPCARPRLQEHASGRGERASSGVRRAFIVRVRVSALGKGVATHTSPSPEKLSPLITTTHHTLTTDPELL